MSHSVTPLVHQVIPLFDAITHALEDTVADESLNCVIRYAAKKGITLLNKYYGLTDDCIIYRVAMCKLLFF